MFSVLRKNRRCNEYAGETACGKPGGDVSPSLAVCRHGISAQLFSVGESRTDFVADFKIGVMDRIVNYRL